MVIDVLGFPPTADALADKMSRELHDVVGIEIEEKMTAAIGHGVIVANAAPSSC